MVQFHVMKNRILAWRRQRWADSVVRTGKDLDVLYRFRGELLHGNDSAVDWEIDFTDRQINRLENKRRELLTKLRETA